MGPLLRPFLRLSKYNQKLVDTFFDLLFQMSCFDVVYFHWIFCCCPLHEPDYHFYCRCPILISSISIIIRLNKNNVTGCHEYQCLPKEKLKIKNIKPPSSFVRDTMRELPSAKYLVK